MTQARRSKKNYNRTMKLIRRAHLYAGLILLPWVLFFGVSGFLLNHNSSFFGGPKQVDKQLTASNSETLSEFQGLNAPAFAAEMLQAINKLSSQGDYQLHEAGADVIGALSYTAHTTDGEVTVKINLESGDTEISKVASTGVSQSKSDFEGQRVHPDSFSTKRTETLARELLEAEGYQIEAPLELKTRGAPQFRFQVVDSDGKVWKTSYNFANGKLSARASDEPSAMNLHSALTRLHKQHNYPDQVNSRWFWTLFADITALTLIFWGVSGGIMWWQMKPTRLIGISGLSVAIVLAALIFGGALSQLAWGRAREQAPAPKSEPAAKERAHPQKSPAN